MEESVKQLGKEFDHSCEFCKDETTWKNLGQVSECTQCHVKGTNMKLFCALCREIKFLFKEEGQMSEAKRKKHESVPKMKKQHMIKYKRYLLKEYKDWECDLCC